MDSGSDRQPVQLTQHGCYVLGYTSARDCTSKRVLETLKFVDVAFRCTIQQTVAIVDTCPDQSGSNGHGRIVVDELLYVTKRPDVIHRCLAYVADMFVESQTTVYRHPQALHTISNVDVWSCNGNWRNWLLVSQPRPGAKEYGFRLIRIERQSILSEPIVDVIGTVLQIRNGIFVFQRDIQLSVIGVL